MPFNDTLLNIGMAAMQTAAAYMSLHSAQPNSSGSNETSATRQLITWDTAANGDMIATVDLPFTGGAANGACTHVGFRSLAAGGTWYGWYALTGDQTFNSAGEYLVTGVTVTGTAT